MKKIISLISAVCILCSFSSVFANENVSVLVNTNINFKVNGETFIPRELDGSRVYPLTYKDRTYIPARFVAERIGLDVSWNENTQTVGFKKGEVIVKAITAKNEETFEPFTVSSYLNTGIKFTFNKISFVPKENDGSVLYPLTYNDRTYIPARYIAEKAGVTVTWDEATQTVGFVFNDKEKGTETEKVDSPKEDKNIQVKPGNLFKSYDDVYEYIEKERQVSYNEELLVNEQRYTNGEFHKQIMEKLLFLGFDIYNLEKGKLIDSTYKFPSYAEMYIKYMQEVEKKSDAEILNELSDIYSQGLNNMYHLLPLMDGKYQPAVYESTSRSLPSEAYLEEAEDENEGILYDSRNMLYRDGKVINASTLCMGWTRERHMIFKLKFDENMKDYMKYYQYYREQEGVYSEGPSITGKSSYGGTHDAFYDTDVSGEYYFTFV